MLAAAVAGDRAHWWTQQHVCGSDVGMGVCAWTAAQLTVVNVQVVIRGQSCCGVSGEVGVCTRGGSEACQDFGCGHVVVFLHLCSSVLKSTTSTSLSLRTQSSSPLSARLSWRSTLSRPDLHWRSRFPSILRPLFCNTGLGPHARREGRARVRLSPFVLLFPTLPIFV